MRLPFVIRSDGRDVALETLPGGPVDKTKSSCYTPYRLSTTVFLETFLAKHHLSLVLKEFTSKVPTCTIEPLTNQGVAEVEGRMIANKAKYNSHSDLNLSAYLIDTHNECFTNVKLISGAINYFKLQ